MVTPDEKAALDAWHIKDASLPIGLRISMQTQVIALTG